METETLASLSLAITGIVIALITWIVWRIFFRQSVVNDDSKGINGWEIAKNILASSSTILLIIFISIPLIYFAVFILGFPKLEPNEAITVWKIIKAPWQAISGLELGMYIIVLVLGLVGIIAINVIKFKLVNWELAKNVLIIVTILTACCAVVISMFPTFSLRGYIAEKMNYKEQKQAIEDGFYSQSDKITIPNLSDIKTPKERQKAIARLSEKVDFLAKANQYNNRYEAEYQFWRERLGFERALVKYETMWGPAKKVELTESDKWIETGLIKPGDRIKYLSNAEFLFKYEKGNGKFKSAITEPYGARFSSGDMVGDQTPVWFSRLKQKTTVYSWIIKNG